MANLGYIQVTRLCNQTCRFCSNPPNRNTLSYQKGIQKIQELMKQGYDGIIFTGGEPTLSEELTALIKYCSENQLACRVITNGQRMADKKYLQLLKDVGLEHIHLSLYSMKPKVQNFLTKNDESLRNILRALHNIAELGGIQVDINTVISKYNADHLSESVGFIVKHFPFIRHFVWNNLDPLMNRTAENPDTIPRLVDFEVDLHRAMCFLEEHNRTFRVERVPLCYMDGFEDMSTETRKIIKQEERTVFFLDEKGCFRQEHFQYAKAECCSLCTLCEICAGLYEMDRYYSSSELYPVFKEPDEIRKMILEEVHV